MAVFVLDKRKKPLMMCSEKRARLLLEQRRARIHRMVPFTIRLIDRLQEGSAMQLIRIGIDPGSKTTGIALLREKEIVNEETGEIIRTRTVLMLLHLVHRGYAIHKSMLNRAIHRRFRRNRLRYRPARFLNRTRPKGWLAPSLQHRVDTTMSWVTRLMLWSPVTVLSQELVRFDMQKMQNPEISGAEYQRGTLFGTEVREYLLEKWKHKCAYCGAKNVPLEIEHIHAKSKGGSNRISNLTLACVLRNQKKDNIDITEFLAHKPDKLKQILAQAKAPLKDAAAVNSTRWALYQRLKATGLNVEIASGGKTKWNRTQLHIPKDHGLDAACVGHVDQLLNWKQSILSVQATGRGRYQRTTLTKYGFPRGGYAMRSKRVFGFQTGDVVKAVVTTGKKIGKYMGRVVVRASGNFNIGNIQGINYRFCSLIQRADGYCYSLNKYI